MIPNVHNSANIAEAAIKRPFVRPDVASRELEMDVEMFPQLISSSRHLAAPMGGKPSNSVTCKCDTKHTLWCVACSTAAGSQAVMDHRTYSQEVINLVECTTITDNRASAYLQRLVMPVLVGTSITSQYVNSIHNKEEFLDIEDDSENIDIFLGETPYDKLCSPIAPLNDIETLNSIVIEGNEIFLSKY